VTCVICDVCLDFVIFKIIRVPLKTMELKYEVEEDQSEMQNISIDEKDLYSQKEWEAK
jgi:hypothetical protein